MRKYTLASSIILTFIVFRADPLLAFSNGQNASIVLGQSNFTSNTSAATQNRVDAPSNVAYDPVNSRLFMTDNSNNRILVFNAAPGTLTIGENASYVLGQNDFTSNGRNTSQNGLSSPGGVAYDSVNSRLFVSDSNNSRVMVFNVAPGALANGENASYVLGQTNWNNGGSNHTLSTMNFPDNPAYDTVNSRLFVPDGGNSRVLVFDVTPGTIANGETASYVLGQANGTNHNGATSQSRMDLPSAATYDPINARIFVSETNNHRILVFNVAPGTIATGENASYVLGQNNFTSKASVTTQNGMETVDDVSYDSATARLFVADQGNHRVLIFNTAPGTIANGENASYVLGQQDFISSDFATTQNRMGNASGVSYDALSARLFVSDSSSNRTTVFLELPNCGSLEICGTITAAESPYPVLAGVPVELRDNTGRLLKTKKTDTSGAYVFGVSDGITQSASYSAAPAVGRTESAVPLQIPVVTLPPIGGQANFQIHGWPGRSQISDAPSLSFILISTFSYDGAGTSNPPVMTPGTAAGRSFYSTVSQWDGTATAQVPAGSSYYLTCWLANAAGGSVNFTRSPASGSHGPYAITPGQEVAFSCQL